MDELRTEVQTKLNDFMSVSFLTIDNMWTAFKDILLDVMEKHVPSKLSRSKQTYPWITTEVRIKLEGKLGKPTTRKTEIGSENSKLKHKKLLGKHITTIYMTLLVQIKQETPRDFGPS